MKILLIFCLFLTTLFWGISPNPKYGQKKEILKLDSKNEYLIQVKFGKNLELDCNHHCFTDLNLDKKTLIGYDYYELSGNTDMAYGNVKKTTKFTEFDSNLILSYNSNLEKIFIFQKILV